MRESEINAALTELNKTTPEIEASAFVSKDGLIIASALAAGMDEEQLGAVVASIFSFSDQATTELGCGTLEQVVFTGTERRILVIEAGLHASLCIIATPTAPLAALFANAERAAQCFTNPRGPVVSLKYDASLDVFVHDGGLSPDEQAALNILQPAISKALPFLVNRFYELLMEDPDIALKLESQAEAMKVPHLAWLQQLFIPGHGQSFITVQRQSPAFKNLAAIPPVYIASSIAFLRVALPPLLAVNAPVQPRNNDALLRLFDLCQYLTDPEYGKVFEAFDNVKMQRAVARQA
ncbi:MAG: hypothetical protein B7Z75_14125 [Acidocella sp. 20-57-95]|nr:MAG: hypothetical protein B7Z75_14125 [Acidocella sp. 20-57-95]OYV58928.1 MAG: hypothetical protein B7Z71_09100 [Acidocella sp. 21-58-7]HQT65262.1 roadblock/LC7 domain-containing protein [Acidocella sp.]HQU05046.1 roadblock/LC7 domain-containing protein [Acidocella sp.]